MPAPTATNGSTPSQMKSWRSRSSIGGLNAPTTMGRRMPMNFKALAEARAAITTGTSTTERIFCALSSGVPLRRHRAHEDRRDDRLHPLRHEPAQLVEGDDAGRREQQTRAICHLYLPPFQR